ncbi:putative methyltransferase-domain-containing protein [Pavlovales sp. CCMP2436]|nr:putative methyltransferase-domain-containing protein [Pavlovales sp. CCMP2436]
MSDKRTRDESDGDESDGSEITRPRKAVHRQRAHNNPLATSHLWRPDTPATVPLAEYYPAFCGPGARPGDAIRWVDLGCGFGSLLLELANFERRTLILGTELRHKPVQYDQKRLVAHRKESKAALPPAERTGTVAGDNVWAIEANSMKSMPNYFAKGQLTKLFICFPDPHFKKRNARRRIVSPSLLAEWARASTQSPTSPS